MKGLQGKTVIVTGAATIIGAAVAREFHARGARAVIADIDEAGGEALAGELGEGALFVKTDITDDGQIEHCVRRAVDMFGGVDFLVNLACSYVDNGIEATRDDWLGSYNVNVVGAVMMMKACRSEMIKRGRAPLSTSAASAPRWRRPAAGSIPSARPPWPSLPGTWPWIWLPTRYASTRFLRAGHGRA